MILIPLLASFPLLGSEKAVRLFVFFAALIFSTLVYGYYFWFGDEGEAKLINVSVSLFTCGLLITYMEMSKEWALKQLHSMSLTDPLTGLNNRKALERKLDKLADSSCCELNKSFALIICDIDYFKRLNDTYGHTAGDKVLVECAQLFLKRLNKGDFAARWGG